MEKKRKEKRGVPVVLSEKFVFEKGTYRSKIQHILDLSHFTLTVNLTGKLPEKYSNIHYFKEKKFSFTQKTHKSLLLSMVNVPICILYIDH